MKILATLLCSFGLLAGTHTPALVTAPQRADSEEAAPVTVVPTAEDELRAADYARRQEHQATLAAVTFSHGDISWLPLLAAEAGWPEKTWDRLGHIILRESGGCPNRRGGDAVDKECNVTNVREWNHRSDTGLLQINGINYNIERNPRAILCVQLDICTQEQLLDPVTNLRAGKLLYDVAGWDPWNPCLWDETRCSPKKKKGK
jgi:hypothetical protein